MSRLRALREASPRRALVMGVLNRTPDSFSDGGAFCSEEQARSRIEAMLAEGADLIDVGAESTRPGAEPVPAEEQIRRIGGAIRHAASLGAIVSIDTTSPEVARVALDQGATIVNSVDPEMTSTLAGIAAKQGAALIVMHCRGSMQKMAGFSRTDDRAYRDVVSEVRAELCDAAGRAMAAGLPHDDVLLDPGLGFAKNAEHSMTLVAALEEIVGLGHPVVVGHSRKSFLAHVVRAEEAAIGRAIALPDPASRLGASIAAAIACAEFGASIVRTHDVHDTRQALRFWDALRRARPGASVRGGTSAEGVTHAL